MLVFLAAWAAYAQTPDTRPAFEAASVKLNTTVTNGSKSHGTAGQLVMANQTLKRLIERAYGVQPFQVTGPDWMEDLHFDVMAKYPPDTKDADRLPMLRTLLEDRFKLAAHRESKEVPGYALVVAKSGFKLKPVEPGAGGTDSEGAGSAVTLKATKISMASLADFVGRRLGEMVVDQTGLDGVYDFELRWTQDGQNPNGRDAELHDVISTLGLRLQAQKVPVEVVVVDHVERVPTEN